ncbi:unnamed protein product, partial [Amoebophrya sp. A25]|eukprot:GSA25T00008168001.1
MWLRTIEVVGWKTYKQGKNSEELHPGRNLIVGYNGSGKSNVLDAILFVVSDAVVATNASTLVHEGGAGGGLLAAGQHGGQQAYVELVFDNAERKAPVESDTVTIRRGVLDRAYTLNGKKTEKHVVWDILEAGGVAPASAGSSAPWWAIRQGQIAELASLSQKRRLRLLHDLLGTTAFDGKKAGAEVEFQKVETQKERAQQMLADLDQRIAALDVEAAELAAFRALERRKKVLEVAISRFELRDATSRMGCHEAEKMASELRAQQLETKLSAVADQKNSIFEERRELEQLITHQTLERQEVEGQLAAVTGEIEQLLMKHAHLGSGGRADLDGGDRRGREEKLRLHELESALQKEEGTLADQEKNLADLDVESTQLHEKKLDAEVRKQKAKAEIGWLEAEGTRRKDAAGLLQDTKSKRLPALQSLCEKHKDDLKAKSQEVETLVASIETESKRRDTLNTEWEETKRAC